MDLSDPNSDLRKVVPFSSIVVTNTIVHLALEEEHRPCNPYILLTPVQKYSIGQRAAENGVCNALLS